MQTVKSAYRQIHRKYLNFGRHIKRQRFYQAKAQNHETDGKISCEKKIKFANDETVDPVYAYFRCNLCFGFWTMLNLFNLFLQKRRA